MSNSTNTAITQAIKVITIIEQICPTAELVRFDSKNGIIFSSNLINSSVEYFDVIESINEFIEVEGININVVIN